MMKPFSTVTSRVIALPTANVDTDQIIPARFLVTIARDGFADALFADWRFDASGAERPECAFNQPELRDARILVAGRNFGCGSSREHAPWALLDYGIRVVIATELADIFRGNSLRNGLLAIEVDAPTHGLLMQQVSADPAGQITVDLESRAITLADGHHSSFEIDAFARHCMLQGIDQFDYLLQQVPAIDRYEAAVPTRIDTSLGD